MPSIIDTEVHQGLENKEMRDMFQQVLVDVYAKDIGLNKSMEQENIAVYGRGNRGEKFWHLRSQVMINAIRLKHAQEWLKCSELRLGILLTMDTLNWREFDISDQLGRSGEHFRSFIGTEEEHQKFMEQFEH